MLSARRKRNTSNPGRLEYLDLLIVEFQKSKSRDARIQVLANLANFAYDPSNYSHFRTLSAIDLFLDHLSDADETIVQFAIGGLCNLCLDLENKDYILKNNGVKTISKLLECSNENVLLSAITTLMYLITPESKQEITSICNVKHMLKLSKGKSVRLRNLTRIFIEDYCLAETVKEAELELTKSIEDIPLPS